MAYDFGFAKIYDKFTDASDVRARADFITEALRRYGVAEGILLDLACGTGRLSEAFILAGYDVISVDYSSEMLQAARERLLKYGAKALMLQQDMRELDLFGTVRAAVCSMDGVNHLLTPEDVRRVFGKVSLFTEPGGVFIFDVNTVYKHRQVLADNTFVYEDDTDFLVWQNEYCAEDDTAQMLLDTFSVRQDGAYVRYSDEITERAYELDDIEEMLKGAGFSEVYRFADRSFEAPQKDEERVYFAAVR
ncbi:MAG: methyltransferase domain-containing protein [Clostridia bacterium]|nr:methyltransferase domain-containing protein [Clostridia bacterium]